MVPGAGLYVTAFTQANSENRSVFLSSFDPLKHHIFYTTGRQHGGTRQAANSTHGLFFDRRAASAQKIQEPMPAILLRSAKG